MLVPGESLNHSIRNVQHLTQRFVIDHIRVRDIWYFQHRLIRKILAHTIGVFPTFSWNVDHVIWMTYLFVNSKKVLHIR